MLRKLRRRFVLLSMMLVGIILVFFYFFTSALLIVTLTQNVQTSLSEYSSYNVFNPNGVPTPDNEFGAERLFTLSPDSICVIELGDMGGITLMDAGQAYYPEHILNEAADYVSNHTYDFGLIYDLDLFYCKNTTLFGTIIAFTDSTQYFSYVKMFLFYVGCLFLLALAVLYVINRLLSKIFLKPIEKAWIQQQNFVADASHELKTPLTVILANTNIIQEHRDDTIRDQSKWVESTYEEATHMKDLVDKLLILAKTDNMKQKNMFSLVNVSDLALRLSLQFEPIAFENGVSLSSDIDKGVMLYCDQTGINQIMHILIDNAVKYAGNGGNVTWSLKKKQNFVYMSAKNSGPPIPEEDIQHIFERFYRSDKARTSGSGYGLGLAICKNLAELHGATISVTSDEANGTVFTVKFKAKNSK